MTIREFTDSKGVTWRVWATFPVHVSATAAAFREGWLTFQSGATRRRIAPVPPNWQDASASRLELVCANAELVSDRPARETNARDEPAE